MSAVKAVHDYMAGLEPEPGEGREELARRMFYIQMEIYSAHAMTTLYQDGDYERLSDKDQAAWLRSADRKLKERKSDDVHSSEE